MRTSDNIRWVRNVMKHVKERFTLTSSIEQSKHLRVTFSDDAGRTYLWVTASTPGDKRAKKNALSVLRRGLYETFGVESIRSLSSFPMQDFGFGSMAADERALQQEWDVLFDVLRRL